MKISIENRKSFIKSLYRQGYSYSKIAGFLDISRQRIEQILHPYKHKARYEVQRAKLKPQPCEYPDCKEIKTEAHHFNYAEPLNVHWLCNKHHKEFHKKHEKSKSKPIRKCLSCGIQVKRKGQRCLFCSKKRQNKLHRLHYKTNLIWKERQIRATKNWIKNNPQKFRIINKKALLKQKENYKINPERFKQASKRYYEANKTRLLIKRKERYWLKKFVDKNAEVNEHSN